MLITFLSVKTTVAQTNDLSNIKTKFIQYRKNNLQEKLYVHTNKDFYVAGEILWFKIYDINGATNKPFDFSKVAYVELLDKNNNPVLQTKVSLDKDKGGTLELPFTIRSGNYTFRAYTSWMKNFSPAFYFHKNLTIVNTTRGNDFPKMDSLLKYNIHFFPEGGNLVNGLQSVAAFKMTDQYGKGVDLKAAVIDQHKDTIVRFYPFKFGLGRFSFTPEAGNLYSAVIKISDNKTIVEDLPVAYDEGYVMHVESVNGNRIKVTVHTNIPAEKKAYLLIHTRGSVKVAEVLSFSNGEAVFEVDKNKLGEGISQITLFNNEKQPVCERLYFKPVKKKLNIQLKADRQQYTTLEKVNLEFNTSDETGKAVKATLSVSVYKLDSLQTINQGNIFNYLWLSSDLTGHIAHPGYYFQNEDHMDNLMLTQGWRRFSWDDVLQNRPPVFQYGPELEGPVISGNVINPKTHSSASEALVYLAIPGKHVQLYGSQSNDEGKIYFNMKHFYGPHQIIVRTDPHTKDREDEIRILSPFSEKYADELLPSFSITPAFKNLLQSHNLWMQVSHAYHENERDQWFQHAIDTTAFYGKPYNTYLLDNYTRYVTMEEVLREYVMEVAVRKRNNHYHFMVLNALFDFDPNMSATLFEDDPLVLFDGIPVFDIDKVIAYDPLKVQKIEAVAGRYFYGPIVADGIVSFTTYKGNLENYPLNPNAVVLDYDGLQRQRIFYSPVQENLSSRIPDFRNVLYWSPDIETDLTGHATCSFYTSGLPGQYAIIVNGITKDGYAGSNVHIFTVTDQ